MMIVLICSNLDKLLAIYIIIVIKKKLLRQKRAVQIISEIISYNSRIFCTLVHMYILYIYNWYMNFTKVKLINFIEINYLFF